MGETRRKFDQDFKEGAVRLVRETGKLIAQVARDLGIVPGTLENWVAKDRRRREGGDGGLTEDERAELVRLRRRDFLVLMSPPARIERQTIMNGGSLSRSTCEQGHDDIGVQARVLRST